MGGLSLWHWIIVLLVVLILFGRGRISEIMGDFGKGIKSFKEGVNEESGDRHAPVSPAPPPVQIAPHQAVPSAEATVVPPVATPDATPVGPPVAPGATPQGVAPVPTDIKTGV